ncbi:MAG: DUF4339 domain-containing protein [Fimbriimonadaceae bacterium]|nr:DUF4339 domain-containing protein [Fimbriimonadaceae bacterium]QYK55746.1 MAG: DUF4339 domain-containing protein [Fimbriimonadaceae bacterium]
MSSQYVAQVMAEHSGTEWFYVGHYGQLGPLTLEQMEELSRDGVIGTDTYVWRPGLSDWSPAEQVAELRRVLKEGEAEATPPPVPSSRPGAPLERGREFSPPTLPVPPSPARFEYTAFRTQKDWLASPGAVPKSDKSRVVAGLLNLIPGIGRFYLGYAAHGSLQLFASMCGVGLLWSWLDGIFILAGGVKYDGYGRLLDD